MQTTGKWKEMWTLIIILSRPAHQIFKTTLPIIRQNQVVRSRTQLQLWHRIYVTRRYYRHPTFALDFFLIIPDTSQHAVASLFVPLWMPCVIEIRMLIEWCFSFLACVLSTRSHCARREFVLYFTCAFILFVYKVRDIFYL